MGTATDLWIAIASIAAWTAILIAVATFADKAASFNGD